MAISFTESYRYFPMEGSEDPALPIGIWQCGIDGAGDASGGEIFLIHLLVPTGQADPSLWSLEQVSYQYDNPGIDLVEVRINNQQNLVSPGTPLATIFQLLPVTGLADRTGPQGRDLAFLPYFIGRSPGEEAAIGLAVTLVSDNNNTVAFRSLLWGYRWGGRAFFTPQGPRRPVGSVFGS